MNEPAKPIGLDLPFVLQIGFAGSRQLLPHEPDGTPALAGVEQAIQQQLVRLLRELPEQIGLTQPHFLCGIAQVAIGGDTLFSHACKELSIPQRIFLPEHRHEYLHAVGSDGTPDFSDAEREQAAEILSSEHVIEERVVSGSADRTTRFEDTNLEILKASDVIFCLVPAESKPLPGGSADLLEQAIRRRKPALEIRFFQQDGETKFADPTWHHRDKFQPPRLKIGPSSLHSGKIPSIESYSDCVQEFASRKANWLRRFFRIAAFAIIATHILATILATLALASHSPEGHGSWIARFLFAELGLLGTGLIVHWYLHRSHAAKEWALSRLVAEIARSMGAISNLHLYPEYLFGLQFPESLQPLLQTLSVLHLRSTRRKRTDPWQPQLQHYVSYRFRHEDSGQIKYYTDKHAAALRWHKWSMRAFILSSLLAVGATTLKLLIVTHTLVLDTKFPWDQLLGILAIGFPALAVGFLSVTASMDVEARVHTYREMRDFLESQIVYLNQATSERDFLRLLVETESRLLGENVAWFWRWSFFRVN